MSDNLESILRTLATRMPWSVAQRLLDAHGMPRGRGWENTIEKAQQPGRRAEFDVDVLLQALADHYLAGEKLVRLYSLKRRALANLRNYVASAEPENSAATRVFPQLLPEPILSTTETDDPRLVGVRRQENGSVLLYSSVRVLTLREEIDPSSMGAETAESLEDFDEIIGLRNVKYQAIDAIWIPDEGKVIEARIDYPPKMSIEQGLAYHLWAKDHIEALAGGSGSCRPINLFPAIEGIYSNASEGNVVELAFGTTTASLEHEKMRRAYMDLRTEIYHRAGKAALANPIAPYRISVRWDDLEATGLTTSPELSLNGTSYMTGVSDPAIYHATVRRCLGREEYDFVRNKLIEYLPG